MSADPARDPAEPATGPHSTPSFGNSFSTAGRFEAWVIGSAPAGPPGFELHEEVGRGGMGVVHRARDASLQRDVAVKVLREHFPAGGVAARRFVEEAQITGQLQHPGIPAVYRVGELPDGRPYLAMKLIKGDTLADLLKANPDRGRLVAIFEGVCQAVGYAHAHGVVHRDLKPANVMVGAFGEVQVMDWGLAKVLAAREREGPAADDTATAIRDPRDESDATRAGSVLGTPAFMAPEQAVGAVDRMDARTDVFGLGAVLCALLTGQPPYLGGDAEVTRQMAARGDLADAFARLAGCGAEPGLVALCRRCLAANQADRPADGGAVAAAVAGLRAAADDRARQAEVERGRAAVREAEGRKRRRVLAVGAALLLAAAGAGGWQAVRATAAEQVAAEQRATVRAAAERAAARDQFALLETLRRRAATRLPGWAVANLADLTARGRDLADPGVRRAARGEAVAALTQPDLRPLPPVAAGLRAGRVATAAAAPVLAVGQEKAAGFVGRVHVHLFGPADGPPRAVSFQPAPYTRNTSGDLAQDGVRSLLLSPDGRRLFAGSRAGAVVRWDLDRPGAEPAAVWAAADRPVADLALSPDGRTVYAAAEDDTVQAWDVAAGTRLARVSERGPVQGVAVDPRTGRVFVAHGGEVTARHPRTLAVEARSADLAGRPGPPRLVAGLVYAAADRSTTLVALDADTLTTRRAFHDPDLAAGSHSAGLSAVAAHPAGTLVASLSEDLTDRTAKVWETASGRLLATVPLPGKGPARLAWAADGTTLFVGLDAHTLRWQVVPAGAAWATPATPVPPRGAGFVAAGREVAAVGPAAAPGVLWAGVCPAEPGRPWAGEWLAAGPGADQMAPGLAAEPAGRRVWFGLPRGLAAWTPGERFGGADPAAGPDPRGLTLSPDGQRLWAVRGGDRVRAVELGGGTAAEWSNAAAAVFSGVSGVRAVAVGRDWAAAAGQDGRVQMLATADLRPGSAALPLAADGTPGGTVTAGALAVDDAAGDVLAGDQLGRVRFLRLPAGDDAREPLAAHAGAVTHLVRVPVLGGWVTAGRDRVLRAWRRTADGGLAEVFVAGGLPASVAGLAHHPGSGRLLIHLEGEYAVRVWELDALRDRLAALGLTTDDPPTPP